MDINLKSIYKLAKEMGIELPPMSTEGLDTDEKREEAEVEEALRTFSKGKKYHPLEFKDPLEMFLFFVLNTADTRRPHKWQAEVLEFFGHKERFPKNDPLRFFLRACNGSGKDSYITALFAVWLISCNTRSRFVCTSASYIQLENQTESYIKTYAESWNSLIGEKIFLIKKQHIVCTLTGSEVQLFSTNEPGRAEGWHPFPDFPEGLMAIVINEAKTIPEDIFAHLKKCTGYNYWIEISSPGKTSGHFYNECIRARSWEDGYNGEKFERKISAYDCPHISQKEIDEAIAEEPGGINNPWIRATYLAEFTSLDEDLVIPGEILDKALREPPDPVKECPELPHRCGIDLGVGGDESVMTEGLGNQCPTRTKEFRSTDTVWQAELIDKTLRDWGFTQDCEELYIDDGNVGHAISDMLERMGWMIQRVLNQSSATSKKKYANRGAQDWFNCRTLIEKGILRLPEDLRKTNNKLYAQLTSRYYGQRDLRGTIILESKKLAKKRGHGSPDRGDSFVLCNCRVQFDDAVEAIGRLSPEDAEIAERIQRSIKGNDLQEYYDEHHVYTQFTEKVKPAINGKENRINGSILSLLKRKNPHANAHN